MKKRQEKLTGKGVSAEAIKRLKNNRKQECSHRIIEKRNQGKRNKNY